MKPRLVRGYASSLYFIAEYIENNNIKIHYPESVISSSETLFPKMREKIEKVFKAKVYDSYGCREVSQIATECDKNCGLHIVMENQIVELKKDNNGRNRVIVTNLNNFCMPIIRYEVGDLATFIEEAKCKCGRTSFRLEKILGRTNENIILKNGKIVNGEYFEFLFYEIWEVERFQVSYSLKRDKMTIRIKTKSSHEKISKFLKKTIFEHLGAFDIEIIYTEIFDKTESGKFKFVWMED
jgi:phenylacetate-CoA ligase